MNVQLDYISHQQTLIWHMHQGDFILVLHNMFERHKAISVTYLCCIHKVRNDTVGEYFGNMTVTQLERAIHQAQSNLSVQDQTAKQFLNSINVICKSMAHTNDAVKGAQLKLFANIVQFGHASIFFMVTPDDSNSFQIQVYIASECKDLPTCNDDCANIDADYESSHQIHQEYLGLCAFDFDQIMELLVHHILGWNQSTQQPRAGGGAFGVLDPGVTQLKNKAKKHYMDTTFCGSGNGQLCYLGCGQMTGSFMTKWWKSFANTLIPCFN